MFPLLHFFSPYPILNSRSFFFVSKSRKHSEEMITPDSFQGLLICEIKQNQNH